ncbi:MAG: UvrD-helicase domain-containing protein [Planctomycetia bacterium]|nr:UvrD-helicase domain-containing protein [Planctomycetia bacterium]
MNAERPFPNVVIRASAGTGKTFQLSNRFLALAVADEPFDAILATTFTRKAAGEILDRVLLRLAEAALDDDKRAELSRFVGCELDRPRCLAILQAMLRQLHRLRVSTLDSFFIQIARSFSLELGLPPGWQIVDEIVDRRLQAEAVRAVLESQSTQDTLRLMNLLSKGEVSHGVSRQISSLVEGLYAIYAESPPEAWDALPRLKPLAPEQLRAALTDLTEAQLPGDKRFVKARDTDLERFRSEQWEDFLGGGLAKPVVNGTATYYGKPIPPDVAAIYEKLIDHAKAVLLGMIANQTKATHELLGRFDEAYGRLKTERRAMRFDDVTRRLGTAWLGGRVEEVAYRLDARLAHLLLDEFQDTSPPQWQVLRPFARQVGDGDRRRSFFCVGDVKQAIYGWRGGVAEIFEAIHRQIDGLESASLDESFRSCPEVIETVNRVFEGIAGNPIAVRYPEAVRRWAARFTKHSTARHDLAGYCRFETAPRTEEGGTQGHDTLAYAAERVARLRDEAPGCTVGVLVRRNASVARLIYELRKRGVAASEEGGNPLVDSPAVELLLSVLALADHPGDTAARFHVAHSPLAGPLGLARHDDAAAAWQLSAEIGRRVATDGYGPTLHDWTTRLAAECDARDLNRLVQLVEMGYGYEAEATSRVDDFIQLVRSQHVQDPTSADVRVMTVHQSKGLQFDVVVLPELDARLVGQPPQLVVGRADPTEPIQRVCRYVSRETRPLLPKAFVAMFEAHERRVIEESLCVLYVALTRAVHMLDIIVAPSSVREKNIPSTSAGILRATLVGDGAIEPETVLYEWGDANWAKTLTGQAAPEAAAVQQTLPLRLAASSARPTRGLDRRSPSQLEGGPRVDLALQLRLDTSGAADRGTLMHAWFEQIAWLEDGLPDDESLRRIAEKLGPRTDLDELLSQFHAALERPAIADALRRATYHQPAADDARSAVHAGPEVADPRWEVLRERRFALRDGESILTGSIDRLVILYNGPVAIGADVLDYKTDAIGPNDPAAIDEKLNHYRPQLDAYRRAVSAMYKLPPERVSARLAFVSVGVIRNV